MAYRFLLEVPEALAAEGAEAVEGAGDAQVILVRDSHGQGFDDPYVDLTIAAHSLRVIDTLYDWFDTRGASRPDIRLVLHGGERLTLEEHDRGAMVAAIRRDQPWVERSIPKIGDHEPSDALVAGPDTRIDAAGGNAPGVASAVAVAPPGLPEPNASRGVRLLGFNHIAVQVADLAKAERFYREFFGMTLAGRARRDGAGGYEPVNGDYGWEEAVRTGTEADVSMLDNGPISLALHRVGRGARLDQGILDHISVIVDSGTYATLRGEVLMRSMQTLATRVGSFTFRDPFGIAWEITARGSARRAIPGS